MKNATFMLYCASIVTVIGGLGVLACGIPTNIGTADDDTNSGATTDTPLPIDDDASSQPPSGDDDTSPPVVSNSNCDSSANNCVDVKNAAYAFDAIGTSVFSYQADPSNTTTPLIALVDHAWSCEQLQSAPPTGPQSPNTSDPKEVVGIINLTFGNYSTTIGGMVTSSNPGNYQIGTVKSDLVDGNSIATASVFYTNNDGSVNVVDAAIEGTVNVLNVNYSSQITGEFSFKTRSGGDFSGRFDASLCILNSKDGGAGSQGRAMRP